MLLAWMLSLAILLPSFLFLSTIAPWTMWLLAVLWVASLTLDLRSTYRFYLEDPSKFGDAERNKFFAAFAEKLGFKYASVAFPLTVEAPILLFIAFTLTPLTYMWLFATTTLNVSACLASSFGILAVGHLQAAAQNHRFTKYKKEQTRNRVRQQMN